MAILYNKPKEWASYQRKLPTGFKPLTQKEANAAPPILQRAREFINRQVKANAPLGTTEEYLINGRRVLFIVEPHYHPPDGKIAPRGWHKGCTVFSAPPSPTVNI